MTDKNKKSPFKMVSENLPFWPPKGDEQPKPFTGVFVSESVLGEDADEKKNIPVYVFADIETCENVYIIKFFAIKKAVEAAKKQLDNLGDAVFHFEYVGKTESNGKPFNQINTGYCTLQEYELSLNPAPEKTTKKK